MKLARFVCLFLLTAATLASGRSMPTSTNSIFLVPQSFPLVGVNADSVVLADVNGDGKPDMVVLNQCLDTNSCIYTPIGTVDVLLGKGDGTFQPAVVYYANGLVANSIVVGDVNGDGKPDLLVANSFINGGCCSGDVDVFLGNGDGTFQPAVSYESGGLLTLSVALGDVNGDGKLDLLVANECADSACSSGSVGVLLGNGDGTFRTPVSYLSGGYEASSVAVGDLNGDGKLDLVVANCVDTCSGLVSVLVGNGDGTFQAAVAYPAGGLNGVIATIGDVNNDGKPDLLVANACITSDCKHSGVSVLLGNGDGTFQMVVTYAADVAEIFTTNGLAVGDVNGDGKADLLVAGCTLGYSSVNGALSVLLGNGDGTFQGSVTYVGGGFALALGDVNGDGKPDVAAIGAGGAAVLLVNGKSGFAAPLYYGTGGDQPYSVVAADVNGDGKVDLLVTNSCFYSTTCTGSAGVLLGKGDGTFQPVVTYQSGGYEALSVAVADVNGDGKPDLLVANNCVSASVCSSGSVGVLLGNGDGTFQPAVSYGSGGQNGQSVAVADVNGDGKPDLIVANYSSNAAAVLLGNGDGTFQTAINYPYGGFDAFSVVVADVNGDGKPDLLVPNVCNNSCISVLLGNGDGTFKPAVSYAGGDAASLAVGDVNGDGKPDLVVGGQKGVGVLLGNGDGTFQAVTTITTKLGSDVSSTVVLADFNGDGKLDIASSNGYALLGNGDGTFQPPFGLNLSGYGATVGDFNGDGKPDLAIGGVTVLLNMSPQAPKVILNPLSLNFGNQTVGATSASQTVTVTNAGNATLNISSVAVSLNNGSATETNNCGVSVAAGASCTVVVSWIPSIAGSMTGSLTFTDNGPKTTQVVALSGVGVSPAVTLSPTKLIFSTQVIFTTSPSHTATLTNTGLGILSIAKIGVSGPFLQTNTCGKSVAAGASCTFTVIFKPTTIGKSTGDISITDNAGNSPQTIALSGFGTYVKLAPTSLSFGNQTVGTKSLPKRVTLSNKGSVAVSITGVSFTGTNAADFAEANTCGTSVAAGASCSITVTFTPSATGNRSATLSVTDDGGASPQTVSVAGTGT